MKSLRAPMLCLSVLAHAGTAAAQGAEWLQDFAAAKQKAKQDNKDLLVDFTGSDWCVWCKNLDKEVFAEAAFQTEAPKSFVLVKLDFPQDEKLVTPEIKQQNEGLQKEYAVRGFPTIFLLDADGRPYAQTGYQAGGAEKYLPHLAELQKARAVRDENFAKAKTAEGIERARALAAGLEGMSETVVLQHYRAEVDEVVKLDADNKAELRGKFEAKIALVDLEAKFQQLMENGELDKVEAAMVEALEKYKGHKLVEQRAKFYRAVALIEGKQDFDGALTLIDEAIALEPDGEWGKRLVQIKKNVEGLKQQHGGKKDGDKKDGDKQEGGGK